MIESLPDEVVLLIFEVVGLLTGAVGMNAIAGWHFLDLFYFVVLIFVSYPISAASAELYHTTTFCCKFEACALSSPPALVMCGNHCFKIVSQSCPEVVVCFDLNQFLRPLSVSVFPCWCMQHSGNSWLWHPIPATVLVLALQLLHRADALYPKCARRLLVVLGACQRFHALVRTPAAAPAWEQCIVRQFGRSGLAGAAAASPGTSFYELLQRLHTLSHLSWQVVSSPPQLAHAASSDRTGSMAPDSPTPFATTHVFSSAPTAPRCSGSSNGSGGGQAVVVGAPTSKPGASPSAAPVARMWHSVAPDAAGRRVILFGGEAVLPVRGNEEHRYLNDLWVFTPTCRAAKKPRIIMDGSWELVRVAAPQKISPRPTSFASPSTTTGLSARAPPPRAHAAMVVIGSVVVVHGGLLEAGHRVADTWRIVSVCPTSDALW
jgi:hypothetical protein